MTAGCDGWVARNPVVAHVLVTVAISWGGAVLAIGGAGAMRGTTPGSDPRFVSALMAMLSGPSLTGVLLTAFVSGRAGLREYLSRLLTWRVGAAWYAFALLAAPAVMAITLFVLAGC